MGVEIVLLISVSGKYYYVIFQSYIYPTNEVMPRKALLNILHFAHEGGPSPPPKKVIWGVVTRCDCVRCLT